MKRLLSLLLALLIAGCANAGAPPEPAGPTTPIPSGVLADTGWVLTLLNGKPLAADTFVSLRFEWATFGGSSGCNRYGGEYAAAEDGSLGYSDLGLTAMLCAEPEGVMKQEEAYIAALGRATAYRLGEDRLELRDAKGRALLVYDAQPRSAMEPGRLLGTAWRMVSMGGSAPLPGSDITLGFLDHKWLTGNAGCRDYVSGYQAKGGTLRLESTSMLQPDCPDGDRLRQEGDYTTLLEWVTGYDLGHGRLELQTDRGKSLVFEAFPAASGASLVGPVWSLIAFVDERPVEGLPVPMPDSTPVISGTQVTIAFQGERASGSAGCNAYEAGAVHDRASVAFGPAAATEKWCQTPTGVMDQEQRLLSLVGSGYFIYHIAGDRLWLRTPDGHALVWVVSVPGELPGRIPEQIRLKAERIVIGRVGRAFHEDYWTFDPEGSRFLEADPGCLQDPANCGPLAITPHYLILYYFRLPGQTGVEAGAELRLDTSGELIQWEGMSETPECVRSPQECVFIDEGMARAVARQAGLEPGLGEWRTHFHWYGGAYNTYVWTVENTLASEPLGPSSGQILLIDANSGQVLETSGWEMTP